MRARAGRLSLGERTGFPRVCVAPSTTRPLNSLETITLTALPEEKSVLRPIGQPRTARRRREQRPTLVPAPGVTFADLGVPETLVAALRGGGITVPFAIQ